MAERVALSPWNGAVGRWLAPLRRLGAIRWRGGRRRRRRDRSRRLRLYHLILAAITISAFAAVRVWDPPPAEALRLQVFDLYQRLKPRVATPQPVVVIDIDDASLREIGQWPWPRTVLADLVQRLARAGAVVIAFDVIFPESDRLSPKDLAERLPGLDEVAREALRRQPGNDDVFAETLRRTRVVLAQAPTGRRMSAGGEAPRQRIRKSAVAEIGGNPRPYLLTFEEVVRNLQPLEQAATGLGSIALSPEADGVARRVPLLVNAAGDLLPSLTIEMLRVATGRSAIGVRVNEAGIDSIIVGQIAIPTDSFARKWVHFAPTRPDRYLSARDVLAGQVGPERIAGRLVIVGTSAISLGDIKATPVSPLLPGVEVHAQLLETILSQSNLDRPNYALGAELSLIVVSCAIILILSAFTGALATLLVGALAGAAMVGGSWYLYADQGLLLDVAFPAVAGFTVYGLLVYTKYMREESSRRTVRTAFQQYLAPELIDRLADHPDQLRLGGEIKELTVLFSDMRGFTSISERRSAEELTRLLNRVLTCMGDAVLRHGGTIDKYIGDCAMAFWNAPLDEPQHARRACLAALDIVKGIADLNRELAAEEGADSRAARLAVGVGINTGEACVGNMGSTHRFNYSVLGDAVNLSSRLEGQTKFYGCPIVVGEHTAQQASDLALLEIDLLRVKGKEQPARVFALLGDATIRQSPDFLALAADHAVLIAAYRAREWDEAIARLAACRGKATSLPLTRVYDIYEDRLAAFAREAPVADWDGVFEALQK